MRRLDDYSLWAARLDNETDPEVLQVAERHAYLQEIFESPIARFFSVLGWYIRSKWADAFIKMKPHAPIQVLEIASGSSIKIPQVVSTLYHDAHTNYTAFNLNKKLTESFKSSVKDLPLRVDIIEDAAQSIEDYIGANKMDVVIFEHAINDILQGMFAARHGIDTDWFDVLPKMVEIITDEHRRGTLENSVKHEFIDLLKSCYMTLKPGGFMCFFHHMYQMDLDCGYDEELYENMIHMARKWIKEAKIGNEVFFDGFDPHWWMFIQKV